jgi:hypothetical protein
MEFTDIPEQSSFCVHVIPVFTSMSFLFLLCSGFISLIYQSVMETDLLQFQQPSIVQSGFFLMSLATGHLNEVTGIT